VALALSAARRQQLLDPTQPTTAPDDEFFRD
jgi:hypothetical protein